MDSQLFLHPLLERPSFAPIKWLGILLRSICREDEGLFLDSRFCSTDLCIRSTPRRLDYCSFVLSFEIEKRKSLNFVFRFAYSGSLKFHVNLRVILSVLGEKICWNFGRDRVDSVDQVQCGQN